MLTAQEARKISKESTIMEETKKLALEKMLPLAEKAIKDSAKYGFQQTRISWKDIDKEVGFCLLTKAETIDLLAEALHKCGYSTTAPANYTSLYINW